jgi:hypothetical protein
MPGDYWDIEEHLSLTGAPISWKIEGYNLNLIKITIQQQGYDEYEVEYPTVEFGHFVSNDADVVVGTQGACLDHTGWWPSGHTARTYFAGNLWLPMRGAAVPWETIITSSIYSLLALYPTDISQTQVDYDYSHHGHTEDEACHLSSPPSQPYTPYLVNIGSLKKYHYWASGKIGWGRGQTNQLVHYSDRKQFQFGMGYRIVLTSGLLDCWDCQDDVETTEYYVGDEEKTLLWTQPYSRTLWQLKFQVEDSYLEELFNEHELDLLSGDIEVDMTGSPPGRR